MMLIQRRSRSITRVIKGLLAVALVLSFTAAGITRLPVGAAEGTGVFLPVIIRDSSYEESIGVLDGSFSQDGWLLTNYSGSLDYGYAILAQPDGKLLVAGSFDGTSQDFGLARFNADGSLDTTFSEDEDGRVHTDFFGSSDEAQAIALQADGMIILVGSAYYNEANRDDFALARYTSAGTLDTNFGQNGLVTTDISGGADKAMAVAVQADGKIVVAGYAYNESTFNYDFALVRYLSNGGPDPYFDTDGKVITDYNNRSNKAYALVLAGEKLVVAGEANNGSNYDFALAQYYANGTLDTDFGTQGFVLTDFAGNTDSARAMVRQSDGKLVVAGNGTLGDNIDFAVARYNPNGSPDTSFGDGGKVTTDIFGGQDYGCGILLQPDDKLVVAGYAYGTQNDFAVARYSSSGVLDNGFGSSGKVYTDFDGRSEWAYGLVRQSDGKLVLAGYMITVAGSDFALARYTTAGALDTDFNEDGWVVMNLFGSRDRAFAVAEAPDGKLVLTGSVEGSLSADFAVARYEPDGDPDQDFDLDGRVTSDFAGSDDYAYAALVLPDGRIVAAGSTYSSTGTWNDFALARYKQDGSLDETFGSGGWAVADYAGDDDCIYAIILQADGKLVVAGEVTTASGQDFALARFDTDGKLDTTFGSSGWAVTDFYGGNDLGQALFQQVDGKLLLAGYAENGAATDFAMVRYSSNGVLDTAAFGSAGKVITSFGAYNDAAEALLVQPDEKIVLVGWSNNGTQDDIALARYSSAGALDTSFGIGGKVITNLSATGDAAFAISIQPDDKLVVAGKASTTTGYDFALLRYLPGGSPDPEFSEDGWLTLDFYGGDDGAQALIMLLGGELVAAGYGDNGTDYDFALVRYR